MTFALGRHTMADVSYEAYIADNTSWYLPRDVNQILTLRRPEPISEETRQRMREGLEATFRALTEEYGGCYLDGHTHRYASMPDVGPTTACWTCDAIVRIQDSYSPKKDDRPFGERQSLCEGCFQALEAKGLAHENLL